MTDAFAVGHELVLSPADAPVTDPVTKFGGQPVWVGEPAWPLSAELGAPMRFIGQLCVPGTADSPPRMAYLFMTQDDDADVEGTWEADGGENALICRPGQPAPFLRTTAQPEGPTVGPDVHAALLPTSGAQDSGSHVGGRPAWLQGDETPWGFSFLLQLDSTMLPFWVNFGDAGIGYAFIDHRTGEGRFLWQSA
ncbi:MAG: hypothetical protein QOI54_705 [Actinomycetota bacterium]|nr:hypothetical protein [Actinomycetota bacterium]